MNVNGKMENKKHNDEKNLFLRARSWYEMSEKLFNVENEMW